MPPTKKAGSKKEKFGPPEPSLETQAALEYLYRKVPLVVASAVPYLQPYAQAEVSQKVLVRAWFMTGLAKVLRSNPRELLRQTFKAARKWTAEDYRSGDRIAERQLEFVERAPKLSEHLLTPDALLAYNDALHVIEDAVKALPPKRRAAYIASCRTKRRSAAAAASGMSIAGYAKHIQRAEDDIARAVRPLVEELRNG